MLIDFRNSFTDRLASKFAIKSTLNIPPHLTNVTTLPCETLMSENSNKLKHYMINDKSQGSVDTPLRYVGYVLLQTFRYVCR